MRRFFAKVFVASAGMRHYVGEWHSHPCGAPRPSGTDDTALHAICQDARVKCPEVVLVLVGGAIPSATHVGVYVYSRRRGRIDLAVVDDEQ